MTYSYIINRVNPFVLDMNPVSQASSFKQNLKSHKKDDMNDKQFVCSICDKQCLNKIHLTAHQKSHSHEKQRPFICRLCGYACIRREYLTRHHRSHIKEKPFVCEICNKAFSYTNAIFHNTKWFTRERNHLFVTSVANVSDC